MANAPYANFILENEVEDQFLSHLDHQQFCKVDTSLEGTAGMIKKINVYSATNGTQDLAMMAGNTQTIEASYSPKQYVIKLAQNRGVWYDEEAMTDPMIPAVIAQHAGTDMFNHVNSDVIAAFADASLTASVQANDFFSAIVDAQAALNTEEIPQTFALINPTGMAALRKSVKDDLKYVEEYVRNGYVGTVAGTNIYVSKIVPANTMYFATPEAVTAFIKKGTEVESYQVNNRSADDANIRKNTLFTRKYYVVALTDATKAVVISY